MLGPLEVENGGRQVALGGPKARALLAILLLHRGEVVPVEQLIERLYEALPSEKAAKSVHAHVSRLRKALGDGRVRTAGGGYALDVSPGEIDLDRFEQLVEEGREAAAASRFEEAARAFRRALALWRGPPFADFRYSDFAQGEIARLEERRLVIVGDRLDADLALGRHADLVPELEALVREHPLRERLRAQLMLALYRSGRQADALEVFQDARRALTEELGIEPSPELRGLQQQILVQEPALELAAAKVPSTPPAPAAPEPTPARVAGHESRKTVTVLTAAISGAPGEGVSLDPEALRQITSIVFERVSDAVAAHGGRIESVSAEAMDAIFGVPEVHEDDAVRAIRAAADIHARLADVEGEHLRGRDVALAVQIGIGTGEIVAGGAASLLVTGAPFIRAERLARAAGPGETLLDEASLRAVGPRAEGDRVTAAGRRAFRLTRVVESLVPRFRAPMVGRARERRRLTDAYEQAVADRSCQLFTVLGAAGVGKSRLVREFLSGLGAEARVARGRCLPYGDGITYWPVLEAIRDAADLSEADSADATVVRLAELLEDQPGASVLVPLLTEVVGLAESVSATEEIFSAVRAFFEALARRGPLVLVFDDIHWGESTFLDLVDHLTDWTRDAPVLLICVARPELLEARPAWGGGKLNTVTTLLEPLSDTESAQLVDSLAVNVAAAARRRIVGAAGGNPLYVEEMLALLHERGDGDASLEMPPTIQALLGARLDRLPDDERRAIEAAAVEGQVFHERSVAELTALGEPEVRRALQALLRKDLVAPARAAFAGEVAYRFRHLLIRDAAYDAIPKELRARLHEAHARWLQARSSERALEFEEILGYHLEQAFHYRSELGGRHSGTAALGQEAAERLGAAGKRAFIRRDAQAAVTLLSRAAALLPPNDPARLELVPNVRVVQGLSGDLGWADAVLTDAVTNAAAAGDHRLEAHALLQRGFLRLFTQPDVAPVELRDVAQAAIAIFARSGDELGLARAWRLMAQAHYLDRHAGLSVDASERALEHARRSGDLLERREVVEWLCVGLMLGPTPASEAAVRCEQLLSDVHEDPILEPTVLSVLGNVKAMLERTDEAEKLLTQFRRAVEELEETIWLFAINFGFIALAGDPVAAEGELRPGYEALRKIGEKSHFSSVSALLARTMYAQGRYDEAYRLTLESEEAARPNDIHSHILWRATRAKVLAQRGHLAAAEALAREAVAFAEGSDFLDSRGDTLLDLAEVLALADRAEDASAAVEAAIRLYEKKENFASAKRARARLAAEQPI